MTVPMPAPSRANIADARAEVRRSLGNALESKASDSFCLQHQHRAARGFTVLEAIGPAAAGPPAATIVEFGDAPIVAPDALPIPSAGLATIIEALRPTAPPDTLLRATSLFRQAHIVSSRNAGYQLISPVYDEIERLSASPLRPSLEVLGAPQVPTLVTQICWLNRTVRTWVGPESLAEVAADTAVSRIDVSRRLMPDATTRNHRTIGLPGFVQRTSATGRGVTVAVIDTEVALNHPALAGRVVHRRNYTAEPWGNPGGHGTAVAGIIGAADPDNGGVAPGVMIYNYKVVATNRFLNGDDFAGGVAIQQALEDNVDIANCSWGAGRVGATLSPVARAVDAASALGMTIVKSAGNDGPGAGTMTTPADALTAVVVGATDVDGTAVQPYSSRGPAGTRPGPDVVAPGGNDIDALVCCLVAGGFGDAGHGTSYAAPHITGLLALVLEQSPNMLPAELRDWAHAHGHPLAGSGTDAQGAGLCVAN